MKSHSASKAAVNHYPLRHMRGFFTPANITSTAILPMTGTKMQPQLTSIMTSTSEKLLLISLEVRRLFTQTINLSELEKGKNMHSTYTSSPATSSLERGRERASLSYSYLLTYIYMLSILWLEAVSWIGRDGTEEQVSDGRQTTGSWVQR